MIEQKKLKNLTIILCTYFLMTACSKINPNQIIKSYKENLEHSIGLEFLASDILYDSIMKDSHLLIEKNVTRKTFYKSGSVEFNSASSIFLAQLNEVALKKCRPTNYWIAITLQKNNKKSLWRAYIASDSKQMMYKNRCFSINFDSSKFLPKS